MKQDNKKTRVGLVTMHRVINYGSALQAYALQEAVEQLGYEVEIIDYLYPNAEHRLYWELPSSTAIVKKSVFRRVVSKIYSVIRKPFMKSASREVLSVDKFNKFYSSYFHLSKQQYATRYWLGKNPPSYDIYLTGSDQVWNPKFIGYDTSFMLSFVQGAQSRISYASSFSIGTLPIQYRDCYLHELSKYLRLSVREQSGVAIIKELLGKDAQVTCDPTLLLDKEQWMEVAKSSDYIVEEPYMLLFILDYAYDPYPSIFDIIEKVHKELKLKIVVLKGRMSEYMKKQQAVLIENVGPEDFLKLFSSASFVITTSFHGTAFAINLEVPFFSIIKDREIGDSRMYSLLEIVGAEKYGLLYNQQVDDVYCETIWDKAITQKLDAFRKQSLTYLIESLSLASEKSIR